MEEVRPLQAMEDDLHQDRHLHPEDTEDNPQVLHRHLEDMEDNLLGLHRHLEATDEDHHLEDMGEGHRHLNRQFPEAMAEALRQVEIMRMLGRKINQANNQFNLTETNLLRHYRSCIQVMAR